MELLQNLDWEHVRFIQDQYDAELVLLGEVLDVLVDAQVKGCESGVRIQPQVDRDLSVEVAAVDRGVGVVVEAVAPRREVFFQGSDQTGLARAGIARDRGGGLTFNGSFH